MIKAYFLDFDGTIVDSMYFWNNFVREYIESKGMSVENDINEALSKLNIHEGIEYIKEKYLKDFSIKRISNDLEDIIKSYFETEVKLKDGFMDFLNKEYEKGIQMYILTANDKDVVVNALKKFEILKCFNNVYSSNDLKMKKSENDIYKYVLSKNNLKKDEVIFFEDDINCIKVISNLGMKVIEIKESWINI